MSIAASEHLMKVMAAEWSPSELNPQIAKERLETAVANCERIKQEATQRAAAMTGYRPELLKVTIARTAVSVGRSNRVVGRRHAPMVHADWAGLTQRQYTTKLSQVRRSKLYALGLTSRGTPRVKPAGSQPIGEVRAAQAI